MRLLLTLLLLLVSGCRYVGGDRRDPGEPRDNALINELHAAYVAKLDELRPFLDADGYPGREDCDLTLWVGEERYAGVDVNLDLVESDDGVIERRPDKPCWENGVDLGSKSTVSQDMITGYIVGRLAEKNLDALERLADYGEAHEVKLPIPGWVMGEPYPEMASRVVLRYNAIGIVGRALYSLSDGSDSRSYRELSPVYVPVSADYERHIQVLAIFADSLVSKGLTDNELEAVKRSIDEEPKNYFFEAVLGSFTGDETTASELLLDPETPTPSYVRGSEAYPLIHWLLAAKIVLDQHR